MDSSAASTAESLHRAAQSYGAGDLDASLGFLRLAIEAEPHNADAHYALGRCLRARGENAGAEMSYRQALSLRPGLTEAWISLGIVLRKLGRLIEAEAAQHAALRLDPANHLAQLNLGNTLRELGRGDAAAAAFRECLSINAECAEAHNNLGRVLLESGRTEEAAPHFVKALDLNPRYFEAALGIGEILLLAQQYAAAIEPLKLASRLRPDDLSAQRKLGRAYSGAGNYEQAELVFEKLLARDSSDRETRHDLALVQFYLGHYTRPRATLERLLREQPDVHVAMTYSSLLLRAGEFREGWNHYEARWSLGDPGLRTFSEPRWHGESLAGKTLLIAREQGLGDEIMFASIISEVAPLAAHCIVECENRLVDLYRRSFPGVTIFGVGHTDPSWHTRLDAARDSLPRFDVWVPLGDLGRLRRNEPTDFPRHQGYLRADGARAQEYRERLRARSGDSLKVGIGWRGGTSATRTSLRSLSLEQLQPLLAVPDVHFVSLQYGDCVPELESFRKNSGVQIDHWQEAIDDIDGTAALVAALDLTISVCSAVIHLGGALGRPTWVMAPLVPEWRYGRDGDSMIWYPSVRMFRQNKSRDWAKVVRCVRNELCRAPQPRQASTGA